MAIAERREIYEREKQPFSKFLCDTSAGTFLGRTPKSWMLITIFYILFYAGLAFFFALMMGIFYQTLDTERFPTYTPGDFSSILRNPALGYRPSPRRENMESTLIWYKSRSFEDYNYWVHELDDFIDAYKGYDNSGEHMIDCSDDRYPNDNEVCMFEHYYLQYCNSGEKWGYDRNQPCVLLKMNRMIDWVPEVFDEIDSLPFDMPHDLRDYINNDTISRDGKMAQMVWLSCDGEGPADKELIGPIGYYPYRGFPAYYFPYRNTPGYLSPLVAIQFLRPEPYILIKIECKIWAKNIIHDRANRLGMVHFELLMD